MSYNAENIKELDTSTPTEGASYIPELNDSDREIKRVIKNQFAIVSKSSNYTLTYAESVVVCTAAIQITLPAASSVAGSGSTKHYWIKNSSAGTVTVVGTVDSESNPTISAGAAMHIFSDGSAWYKGILGKEAPIAHASSHISGGSDSIKLDDLAAPDDTTDLDVSTSAHGLCPKAPNDTSKYLRGDGTWAAAPSTPSGYNYVDHAFVTDPVFCPYHGHAGTITGTVELVAQRTYWMPFIPRFTFSIVALGTYITTGDPGKYIQVGIYDATSAGKPDTRLEYVILEAGYTGGALDYVSEELTAGQVYYLAIWSDGEPGVRSINADDIINVLGHALSSASVLTGLYVDISGGLPADASGYTFNPSASDQPECFFKI
jgi:hypothetical protein